MNKLNTIVPASNQIWKHIASEVYVVIEKIAGEHALCTVMDGAKVGRMKVIIPASKFMCWGNRGMIHIRNRKGQAVKSKATSMYGTYNPRQPHVGAK